MSEKSGMIQQDCFANMLFTCPIYTFFMLAAISERAYVINTENVRIYCIFSGRKRHLLINRNYILNCPTGIF